MTHSIFNVRPAATAIAAVLALSSVPLAAQEVDPVSTTPVTDTAPPAQSDPLAPEPVAETPAAAEPAAAGPTRTTRARTTTPRTSRAQAAPRASAPRSAAAAPAAVTPAPAVEPIAPTPVPAESAIAETPAPAIAAPVEQPSPSDTFLASDEALPVAGAVGLGLLALAAAGLVSRRRRRRREAEEAQWEEYAEATPTAVAEPGEIPEPQRATMEPTFVRAFADAPVAAAAAAPLVAAPAVASADVEGPTTDLPEGFDLSRFGPHVQAAYKGPTPDNPSLSLKYRLRRAAALDQMARKAETAPAAAPPAQASVPRPAADQANGEFLLRRAATKPSVKPAYSE